MLEVDNLEVAYGRIEALHGVSISVGHGELLGHGANQLGVDADA
jgi:ABC-type branched-subunit amino acid transport system ATPase component